MLSLRLLICVGCLLGVRVLHAQPDGRYSLSLRWGVYVPSDGGFLNHTTAIAPSVEWNLHLTDALRVGAGVGFVQGAERAVTTDIYEGDAVTGFSDRSLTLIPVTAHLRWYPGTTARHRLRPYAGLAAGVQYAGFRITGDQINTSRRRSWGAVARPEAGIGFTPGRSGNIRIEIGCSWQYASNKWASLDVQSLQGVFINAGVGITLGTARINKK